MTDRSYDCIKTIALICTPILTFLTALVSIWNVPFSAELTATFSALDILAGAIVVVAKKIYEDHKKKEGEQ